MCKIAVKEEPRMAEFISDQYMIQETKSAGKERLFALIYVIFFSIKTIG